jgi:hypothetical protein
LKWGSLRFHLGKQRSSLVVWFIPMNSRCVFLLLVELNALFFFNFYCWMWDWGMRILFWERQPSKLFQTKWSNHEKSCTDNQHDFVAFFVWHFWFSSTNRRSPKKEFKELATLCLPGFSI